MKKLTQQLLVPIICLLCSSYSIAQIKAYPTDSIITHQREAIFHTLTLSETYTNKEINLLCYGNHFNDKATVKLNYTAKNTIKTKSLSVDIDNISFTPTFISTPIIIFYFTPENVVSPTKQELIKAENEDVKIGEIALSKYEDIALFRISKSKYQILRINKIEVSNMPYDAFLFPNTDIRNYKYNRD